MAFVEILDVALSDLDAERLRGRNIEAPKTNGKFDGNTFHFAGWVLGRTSPAETVEVVHNDTVLQSAPIDVQRPDIANAFPEATAADQSGFRASIVAPDSGEFELLVRALLQDEETVSLGVIRVRRGARGEAMKVGSSVQDPSGPRVQKRSGSLERFFRRFLGRRGG